MANFSKGTGYSKSDLKGTGSPIILYGRLYTKYETIIRNVDTFVVPKSGSVFSKGGEVIVPGSGETAEDISIASVVEPAGILLGGDLNIIYPNSDLDPAFLAITISNGKPHFDMARRAQGKSVVHLHNADLKHILLKTPNLSEQKRISKIFESLDQTITLHEDKKRQLERIKSALLQKMFANKSEYPAIRFEGFSAEWEQYKLGDVANFSKGTGYSKSDLKGTGSPIILYGRLYTKYETIIRNVDTFVVPKSGSVFSKGGEVIVPGSGETAEDISIASVVEPAGILLGGDLNIIYPNSDLDPAFLAITISNGKPHFDMARRAQGKSVVHLHNADLKHILLKTPNLSEQKRISKIFESLDQTITLHDQKLSFLKRLKQTLLQKMFI